MDNLADQIYDAAVVNGDGNGLLGRGYPLSHASRAFLAEMREKTAPQADAAPEPMMRVEVAGLDLIMIDASERYEGCPGCAALRAELDELAAKWEAPGDDGYRTNPSVYFGRELRTVLERTNDDT